MRTVMCLFATCFFTICDDQRRWGTFRPGESIAPFANTGKLNLSLGQLNSSKLTCLLPAEAFQPPIYHI